MKKPKCWLQYVKSLSPIKSQILPGIALPAARRKYAKSGRPREKQKHLERDLELDILRYLDMRGVKVGKVKIKGVALPNGGWGYDKWNFTGKADLEAFYNGVMYAIEVKAPGEKIKEGSKQDEYRALFHCPPSRIFIEASKISDVCFIAENKC